MLEGGHVGREFSRDRARAAAKPGAEVEHAHGWIERERLHEIENVLLVPGGVRPGAPKPLRENRAVEGRLGYVTCARWGTKRPCDRCRSGVPLSSPPPSVELGEKAHMRRTGPASIRLSWRQPLHSRPDATPFRASAGRRATGTRPA